jgi:hypothetical protein
VLIDFVEFALSYTICEKGIANMKAGIDELTAKGIKIR